MVDYVKLPTFKQLKANINSKLGVIEIVLYLVIILSIILSAFQSPFKYDIFSFKSGHMCVNTTVWTN